MNRFSECVSLPREGKCLFNLTSCLKLTIKYLQEKKVTWKLRYFNFTFFRKQSYISHTKGSFCKYFEPTVLFQHHKNHP